MDSVILVLLAPSLLRVSSKPTSGVFLRQSMQLSEEHAKCSESVLEAVLSIAQSVPEVNLQEMEVLQSRPSSAIHGTWLFTQ
eukprot:1361888-Amphidinium_carterae.1